MFCHKYFWFKPELNQSVIFCQTFVSAEIIISVVMFTLLITPSLSTSLMRPQTEPPGTLVTTLNPPPEFSSSINLLEDVAGGQTIDQEFRTSLRIILDASPPAPTAITDEILNRLMHRFAGQAKVYRDNDYQTVAKVLWWKLPCAPQPQHVYCQSKRKWEAAMQGWRKELRKLSLEAVVTLLSTRCNTAVVILQQWFMQQWLPCIVHTELETLNSIPDYWCMFQLCYLCLPLHVAVISLSLDV